MTGGTGNILLVVHGAGRGREVPTGEAFVSRLRESDPAFAARLRVHRTGSAQPLLAGIDLVLFWLGDPLQEKYPDCYAEAVAIANDARAMGIAILNPPEALNNTSKTQQAAIWRKAGIPCAEARIVRSEEELLRVYDFLRGDCIVRSDVEHAQRGVPIVHNASEARDVAAGIAYPAAVIRMHDIRAEYRAAGEPSSSLYSRFHHKARAFVFGDKVLPSHLFFSRAPIVGLSNSLFARESSPRRRLARAFGFRRKLVAEMIREDMRYFETDVLQARTLANAVRALGLDFAAVDYSIRPDGSVILWEANPYFYLPAGDRSVLSSERDAVRRVNQSFDWMAAQLAARAGSRQHRVA